MSIPASYCCVFSAQGLLCLCPPPNVAYPTQQHHGSQYASHDTGYGHHAGSSAPMQQASGYGTAPYQHPQGPHGQQSYTQSSGSTGAVYPSVPLHGYNGVPSPQYAIGSSAYAATAGVASGSNGQRQPQHPGGTQSQITDDFNSLDCQDGSVSDDDPNLRHPVLPQQPRGTSRRAHRTYRYRRDHASDARNLLEETDRILGSST